MTASGVRSTHNVDVVRFNISRRRRCRLRERGRDEETRAAGGFGRCEIATKRSPRHIVMLADMGALSCRFYANDKRDGRRPSPISRSRIIENRILRRAASLTSGATLTDDDAAYNHL